MGFMNDVLTILGWTLLAGCAMPLGAALAHVERIRPRWLEAEFRHFVIAFGGGALLSAVALVLVPEGMKELGTTATVTCFVVGGGAFLLLDLVLSSLKVPAAQLVAMLADFLPEAVALGAIFSTSPAIAPLLAGIIALQNLPEGFNSYRELLAGEGVRGLHVIVIFLALAMLGPACGLAGYFWLAAYPVLLSGIMLFSAGGILYLVFQDIAPQAKLERRWAPPLGAVIGFSLGLLGHALVAP